MSNSVKKKDLKVYLKNSTQKEIGEKNKADLSVMSDSWKAMNEADAVTQKMLQEDDSNTSESISESDAIAFYTDSVQKTIQIKLDHNSADVLNMDEEFESGKDEKDTDKLKIYDYNESVIIENEEAESSLVKSKGTLHIVTDEKPTEELRCTHCSYTTNKRFLLTRHIKTHSTDRPLKCSFCERGFKTNISLINHVNSHLGKKPHHCKSCEMRFNTAGELGRHVRYKHTHEKPHKCGECDYSSVELSKMRRHMRCHTGERPYQCPHCTYASPDTFKLKRHLRTHTGEKPYECDICMARFTQSNSLKSHKLIHSVGERPVFQCTLCPTTCGRKTDLQLHVQNLHTSDVPIKCKRCGKELPDRYTYKVHVKTHEGEKCYRCNICPYASISQRHLDMHMLIHTDEKPFSCEQCGLSFRQRQLLMRHVNIYHNKNYVPPAPQEKNHICPHCRRAFLRKGNLMRHMEMHDTHFVNSIQKIQLKIGRKMRIPEEASSYSTIMMPENEDEVMDDNSTNDEKNIEYKLVEDENDDDVETFEVIDDLIDEAEANSEAKEKTLKCHLIYKSSPPKTKTKKKTPAVLVTSSKAFPKYENKKIQNETKKRSSNIFIVPSGSTSAPAIKKTDTHLPPIKIEYDCTKDASDTDDVNENFVIIEVIETDGVTDDTVGSNGESNSMIAGDILEIPFQAAGKRDHINTFGFVDDDEYVLPVEVNEDD